MNSFNCQWKVGDPPLAPISTYRSYWASFRVHIKLTKIDGLSAPQKPALANSPMKNKQPIVMLLHSWRLETSDIQAFKHFPSGFKIWKEISEREYNCHKMIPTQTCCIIRLRSKFSELLLCTLSSKLEAKRCKDTFFQSGHNGICRLASHSASQKWWSSCCLRLESQWGVRHSTLGRRNFIQPGFRRK